MYTVLRKERREGVGKMKGRGNYWEGGGFGGGSQLHRINKKGMLRGAGILCTEPKLEFTNAKHFSEILVVNYCILLKLTSALFNLED